MKKAILEARSFIRKNQEIWFEEYKSFLKEGRVLIVGHGLGYTTEIISQYNPNVVAIDILLEEDSVQKEKVTVYDGDTIPFENNTFDAVVTTYVLHHTDSVDHMFRELNRVSNSKIIIIEETHSNIFQKIDCVFSCWHFNRKAGQKVQIKWNSYLTSQRLLSLAQNAGLQTILHKEVPTRSYKTELFVFSK